MIYNITIHLNEKGKKIVGADTRVFEMNSNDPYLDRIELRTKEIDKFLDECFPYDELIAGIEINRNFKDAKVGDIVRIVGLNCEGYPEHEVITEIDMVEDKIITTKEGLPFDGDLITSMFYRNNGKAAWSGRYVHLENPSYAEILHYRKINKRAELERNLIWELIQDNKLCENLEKRLEKNGELFSRVLTRDQLEKIRDIIYGHDDEDEYDDEYEDEYDNED